MEQKSVGAESVMLRSRHGRIIVRVARGEARSFLIFAMLPLCSVFCVHIFSSLWLMLLVSPWFRSRASWSRCVQNYWILHIECYMQFARSITFKETLYIRQAALLVDKEPWVISCLHARLLNVSKYRKDASLEWTITVPGRRPASLTRTSRISCAFSSMPSSPWCIYSRYYGSDSCCYGRVDISRVCVSFPFIYFSDLPLSKALFPFIYFSVLPLSKVLEQLLFAIRRFDTLLSR